jgi:dihydrofolate synthase/folylpolyglutamate synthase
VAGTNGKGSVSHTLAAILQSAGYKTGLYTSPHLKDFRERIRIDGKMIPEQAVVSFVSRYLEINNQTGIEPSFFELTVAMAFDFFASQQVDIAVIEVGLGGRLDSTNIILPELSIITNISFDHISLLGNTLEAIASEKAGIIKPSVPVVVGETVPETKNVFLEKARQLNAPIRYADEEYLCERIGDQMFRLLTADEKNVGNYGFELGGDYQKKNLATIYVAVDQLKNMGYLIPEAAFQKGLSDVCSLTGLQGRWQKIGSQPLVICDTGHNEAGIGYVVNQIKKTPHQQLHMVIGMVNDKAIGKVLSLMPRDAEYYFTQANIDRALDAHELKRQAENAGLKGCAWPNVGLAYKTALSAAGPNDLVFVGGSSFVVAEVL